MKISNYLYNKKYIKKILVFMTILNVLLAQQVNTFALAPFHDNAGIRELADLNAEEIFDIAKLEGKRIARFIDKLGIDDNDCILHIGPGSESPEIIAAMIKGATNVAVQPYRDEGSDSIFKNQMTELVRYVHTKIREIKKLFPSRRDIEKLVEFRTRNIQDKPIERDYYSHIFLFRVLDYALTDKDKVLEQAFLAVKDGGNILLRLAQKDNFQSIIELIERKAKQLGYRVTLSGESEPVSNMDWDKIYRISVSKTAEARKISNINGLKKPMLDKEDGSITQGTEALKELNENRKAGRYKFLKDEYPDIFRQVQRVASENGISLDGIAVYDITSIVKGKKDFVHGYFDRETNELFLSINIMQQARAYDDRHGTRLLDEYIEHECRCRGEENHQLLRKEQREKYAQYGNYKIDGSEGRNPRAIMRESNTYPSIKIAISRKDLIHVLTSKGEMRSLLEGGPIRQPGYFALIERSEEELARLRGKYGRGAIIDNSYNDLFVNPADVIGFQSVIQGIKSGQIDLPIVFKPNQSAWGVGIFFLTKSQTNMVVFTMDYSKANEELAKTIEEYFRQHDKKVEIRVEQDVMQVELNIDAADFDEILYGVWRLIAVTEKPTMDWDSYVRYPAKYDSGMVETMMPFFKYDGKAYETRHRFKANLSTGKISLEKERIDISSTGWFARIGTSSYFSNQSSRDGAKKELDWQEMFEPLYESFQIFGEKRKHFEDYVDRIISEEFNYLIGQLKRIGIHLNENADGQFDIAWLPPDSNSNGFPVPVLIESSVIPDIHSEQLMMSPVRDLFRNSTPQDAGRYQSCVPEDEGRLRDIIREDTDMRAKANELVKTMIDIDLQKRSDERIILGFDTNIGKINNLPNTEEFLKQVKLAVEKLGNIDFFMKAGININGGVKVYQFGR